MLYAIGNRVWYDTDGDGLLETGEYGADGIVVALVSGAGEALAQTTTSVGGYYRFDALAAGLYRIVVGLPDGYRSSGDSVESSAPATFVDGVDKGLGEGAGAVQSALIVVGSGQGEPMGEIDLSPLGQARDDLENSTMDFGLYRLAVGDLVWDDADRNGRFDQGERGMPDVGLELLDGAGAVAMTTTTRADGGYVFAGLVPGVYAVRLVAPAAWLSSEGQELTGGNDGVDHGAIAGDYVVSAPFEVAPGGGASVDAGTGTTFNSAIDFGLQRSRRTDFALRTRLAPGQSAEVQPGAAVAFDIELFNQGEVAAQQILLVAYLPAGLELADSAWQPGDGTSVQRVVTPLLSPGQSITVALTLRVAENALPGQYGAVAEIAAVADTEMTLLDDIDSTPDRDPGNEGLPVDDEVTAAPPVDEDDSDGAGVTVLQSETDPQSGAAVLEIAKRDMQTFGAEVTPGSAINYVIVYTNTGTTEASGVEIIETVPAETTFDPAMSDGAWVCDGGLAMAGTRCVLSVVYLGPGQSGTIFFSVRVNQQIAAETTGVENVVFISSKVMGAGQLPSARVRTAVAQPLAPEENGDASSQSNQLYLPVVGRKGQNKAPQGMSDGEIAVLSIRWGVEFAR